MATARVAKVARVSRRMLGFRNFSLVFVSRVYGPQVCRCELKESVALGTFNLANVYSSIRKGRWASCINAKECKRLVSVEKEKERRELVGIRPSSVSTVLLVVDRIAAWEEGKQKTSGCVYARCETKGSKVLANLKVFA